MASFASYLGSEFYLTGPDAEKPTEADKIKYWRDISNIGSGTKQPIEGEVTDGDGYSLQTTGKRSQKPTVIDIHYSDQVSIQRLDQYFNAKGKDEVCKIWFKRIDILGWEDTKAFCSYAIITDKTERNANGSTGQGASYTFSKNGAPLVWDGTLAE